MKHRQSSGFDIKQEWSIIYKLHKHTASDMSAVEQEENRKKWIDEFGRILHQQGPTSPTAAHFTHSRRLHLYHKACIQWRAEWEGATAWGIYIGIYNKWATNF